MSDGVPLPCHQNLTAIPVALTCDVFNLSESIRLTPRLVTFYEYVQQRDGLALTPDRSVQTKF